MNDWLDNVRSYWMGEACLLCQQDADGYLCTACQADLPWMSGACRRCAIALPQGEAMCGVCCQAPPHFMAACAAFHYADPVEWMIKRLKFHDGLVFGAALGKLMVTSLPRQASFCRPDGLLPVPLHAQRLRERGYNQAHEIAKVLAEHFSLPLELRHVMRRQNTAEQSGLDAKQRKRNVVNAFETQRDFSGRHIAIVDDVMTTGATLNELAKCLKQAGASRVDVWVCARS